MSNITVDALLPGIVNSTTLIPAVVTSAATVSIQPKDFAQVLNLSSVVSGTISSTALLFGTVTSSAPVVFQAGSFPLGTYRVGGLIGVPTAGAPTTKLTLSADVVELWNPIDNSKRFVTNTGSLINDITTTSANGRDQVAAFTASHWLHYYFTGPSSVSSSTLQTRVSLSAPPAGPILQSSETYWAYAGAVRLNASTMLVPTRFFDEVAQNNITDAGENRILNGGRSTIFTPVDASALIPPNSRLGIFNFICIAETTGLTVLQCRPTGSTEDGQTTAVLNNGNVGNQSRIFGTYPVSSSQSLDYSVNSSSTVGFIDVFGYKIPNGA